MLAAMYSLMVDQLCSESFFDVVGQGQICSDNLASCHSETEATDQHISPSQSILTPGQPVVALNMSERQTSVRVAMRMLIDLSHC